MHYSLQAKVIIEQMSTVRREAQLSVRNVSLSFGGTLALNHVSFDVRAGEILAIIGPNGAGVF